MFFFKYLSHKHNLYLPHTIHSLRKSIPCCDTNWSGLCQNNIESKGTKIGMSPARQLRWPWHPPSADWPTFPHCPWSVVGITVSARRTPTPGIYLVSQWNSDTSFSMVRGKQWPREGQDPCSASNKQVLTCVCHVSTVNPTCKSTVMGYTCIKLHCWCLYLQVNWFFSS